LGKCKAFTQKKKIKICEDKIELDVWQKNLAYKKYPQTKAIDSVIECTCSRAIAKREITKRLRKSWEKFISHLESAIYKYKQTHLNY